MLGLEFTVIFLLYTLYSLEFFSKKVEKQYFVLALSSLALVYKLTILFVMAEGNLPLLVEYKTLPQLKGLIFVNILVILYSIYLKYKNKNLENEILLLAIIGATSPATLAFSTLLSTYFFVTKERRSYLTWSAILLCAVILNDSLNFINSELIISIWGLGLLLAFSIKSKIQLEENLVLAMFLCFRGIPSFYDTEENIFQIVSFVSIVYFARKAIFINEQSTYWYKSLLLSIWSMLLLIGLPLYLNVILTSYVFVLLFLEKEAWASIALANVGRQGQEFYTAFMSILVLSALSPLGVLLSLNKSWMHIVAIIFLTLAWFKYISQTIKLSSSTNTIFNLVTIYGLVLLSIVFTGLYFAHEFLDDVWLNGLLSYLLFGLITVALYYTYDYLKSFFTYIELLENLRFTRNRQLLKEKIINAQTNYRRKSSVYTFKSIDLSHITSSSMFYVLLVILLLFITRMWV